jgi:hypothetical protein
LSDPSANLAPVARQCGQRGGQHDSPLVAVDPDHELRSHLLEGDVPLLREREIEAQPRAPVLVDHQLVGERVVQHGGGVLVAEGLAGQAVEHLGPVTSCSK